MLKNRHGQMIKFNTRSEGKKFILIESSCQDEEKGKCMPWEWTRQIMLVIEVGCDLVAKWVWFGVEEVSYMSMGSPESSVVKNITKLPLPLREVPFVDLRDYH